MRRPPPREQPPGKRFRRDLPRPEGPFDRLPRRRPERDPAPIIIGGTIAFLAIVIVLVFAFSSLFGGGNGGGGGRRPSLPGLPRGLTAASQYIEFETEEDTPAIIGLPLREATQDPAGL